MPEITIKLNDENLISRVFGDFDFNTLLLEKEFGVKIFNRKDELKITGGTENIALAEIAVNSMINIIEREEVVTEQTLRYIISMTADGNGDELKNLSKLSDDTICIGFTGKPVKAKTIGQKKYVDCIKKNTVTFAVGPAGTGKTYLAVALAVKAFKAHEAQRIILTRPAVEAGEKLGFLPGDLQNKVDPYLRPLYDALYEMLGAENFQKNMERGNIEVAPLAYMRGRTLDESFIILDEAQNTTPEQMKMFLTRLGFNSKMVITGDITQIDLTDSKRSGLVDAVRVLKNIDDIAICKLSEKDVVRHRLVQSIIKAYEKTDLAVKTNTVKRGRKND